MQKKQTNISLLKLKENFTLDIQAKFTDIVLQKFLKANQFDIQKTVLALKDFLIWEQQLDVENQLSEQQIKELKVIYPHGYCGTDRQGRPIYIQQLGKTKINELLKFLEENAFVTYFKQRMDFLIYNIFPMVQKKQLVVIIDINGPILKMASKRVYNIINNLISLSQKYYPQFLYKLYITNTPILFQTAWNHIKNGINTNTQKKIIFLGSDYQEQLNKIVSNQNLPQFLGGQVSNSNFLNDFGPWKSTQQSNLQEQQEQQQQIDFSSLKAALSNIIPHHQKQQTFKHGIPDTPLNTESDQKK